MAEVKGNGVSWINGIIVLVAFGGVVLTGAGGVWNVFQTQFGYIEKDKEIIRQEVKQRANEVKTDLDRREADNRRRDEYVSRRVDKIEQELLVRRHEFVQQEEFKLALKAFDDRWHTQAEINKTALDVYLTAKAFTAWKDERDKTIQQLLARIERLENKDIKVPDNNRRTSP